MTKTVWRRGEEQAEAWGGGRVDFYDRYGDITTRTFKDYPQAKAWLIEAGYTSPQVKTPSSFYIKGRRFPAPNPGRPDAVAARELYLYITSDGDLYRQQHLPIIKNLARKVGRGVYDKKLAVKLWMYLADEGARRYNKEVSGTGYTMQGFDKPTRFMVAAMLARDFMDKYRGKEYSAEVVALGKGRLINPAFRGGHLLSGGIDWSTDVKHEGDPNAEDIAWEKRRAVAAVMKLIGPDLAKWQAKTRFKFTGFQFDSVVWHLSAEQEEQPEEEQGEPTEPRWHYSLSFIGPAAMVTRIVKHFGGSWKMSNPSPKFRDYPGGKVYGSKVRGRFKDEMQAERFMVEHHLEDGFYRKDQRTGEYVVYSYARNPRGLTRQGPACYASSMASNPARWKVYGSAPCRSTAQEKADAILSRSPNFRVRVVKSKSKRTRFPWQVQYQEPRPAYTIARVGSRSAEAARRNPKGKLSRPLSWADLCDCGHTREHHQGNFGFGPCGACECPSFREAESNPYTRVRFPAHSSRLFRSKKSGRWTPLPGRQRNPMAGALMRKGKKLISFTAHSPSREMAILDSHTMEATLSGSGYKRIGGGSSLTDYLSLTNPRKGATLIGRKVLSVVYLDESKARRCGAKNPSIPWKHDFSSADARVYGLSDGSVLIKSDKKKLWGYR